MKNFIGKDICDIPTPALIVDLDAVMYNVNYMQSFVNKRGINIRPHIKTHKSTALAHIQKNVGCKGICCATVEEVEAMTAAGFDDIMLSNEVVEHSKLTRIAAIAKSCTVIVAIDSYYGLDKAASAAKEQGVKLNAVIDIDTGMGRCGIKDVDLAIDIAKAIEENQHLVFKGIMAYNGKNAFLDNQSVMKDECNNAYSIIEEVYNKLTQNCIEVEIVSVSGTGNFEFMGQYPLVTELQSGSYIFSDSTYNDLGVPFKPALKIMTTVISKSEKQFILDGGTKSISTDLGLPALIDMDNQAKIRSMSEEHVVCDIIGYSSVSIGDKIFVLPSHCCTTNYLHRYQFAVRGNKIEAVYNIIGR